MILVFTGARRGTVLSQWKTVGDRLYELGRTRNEIGVMHGGAQGADATFHGMVVAKMLLRDAPWAWLRIYPALGNPAAFGVTHERLRDRIVSLPPATPLDRNRLMLTEAKRLDPRVRLLAVPSSTTELRRSGTWATVRYARELGVPITLVLPDGSIREER